MPTDRIDIKVAEKALNSIRSCVAEYVEQCVQARTRPNREITAGLNVEGLKAAKVYEYVVAVDGKEQNWTVVDFPSHKFVMNETDRDYFQIFNKTTGFNVRLGKDVNTDPSWCPLGPEILDLEISINGCPRVGGASCKFCYKNNTDKPATNMSLADFRKIVGKFPRNLSQIALGITGVQTNPDFKEMLRWLREDMGIVPNYTLSGADLNDDIFEATLKYCGRVAVSVYETDKNLCYNTIKRFNESSPNFCNMHLILSDYNLKFVNEVLDDIENGKVEGLRNIVFLRCKPVGRASVLPCTLSPETLDSVITRCTKIGIGYGFDSCSCGLVQDYFKSKGKEELIKYCEPCESSRQSGYINTFGQYYHCSFCEHVPNFKSYNFLTDDFDFQKFWVEDCEKYRKLDTMNNCPCFKILENNAKKEN